MATPQRTIRRPVVPKTTQDLTVYFGPRNRVNITPQYTQDALRTMETRQEADVIARTIDSLFQEDYTVSIYPANVGGVIFALADLPHVVKIFTWEPDSSLRQLLNNNITAYGFGNKIEVTQDYQKEGTPVVYLNTAVRADVTINIDNVFKEAKFPLYVIRVPLAFTKKEEPGYVCTIQETIPNAMTKLLLCEATAPPQQEEGIEVDEAWLNSLIALVDKTLKRIIPSAEERQAYLQDDLLSYWIRAFTSKTIDPNLNYEQMEMLGDRSMKFGFADYLIQLIDGITEQQLTELQNYYLTTLPQANMARKLGFGSIIRIAGEVKEKVLEDVLEAFFGALFRVSEEIAGGRGYYNVFTMIASLYKNEPFVEKLPTLAVGRDKTVFIQSLTKLRLGEALTRDYEEDEQIHYVLSLRPNQREYFESHGIILPTTIGHGTGRSKKGAETAAYAEALALFRSKGITSEWIENQRAIMAFDRPEYQPYLATARARLAREGFVKMTFSSPASTTTTRSLIVQLIGHRLDGSQKILASVEAPEQRSGRLDVLRIYAEGK